MAEENNAGVAAEVVKTDASVQTPATKKQRASQRRTTVAPMVGARSTETTAKSAPLKRTKRGGKDGAAKLNPVETQSTAAASRSKVAVKAGGKKTVKQAGQTGTRPVAAIEEMADLIQLEEENKRLRKTLADKLRQENAELRKRLGLD